MPYMIWIITVLAIRTHGCGSESEFVTHYTTLPPLAKHCLLIFIRPILVTISQPYYIIDPVGKILIQPLIRYRLLIIPDMVHSFF